MEKIKNFFSKHSSYYSILWSISLWLAGVWAFYRWIVELFINAREGNFLGFIIVFLLQSLIMGISAIIGGIIIFIVLIIITLIPYLIIRGLFR